MEIVVSIYSQVLIIFFVTTFVAWVLLKYGGKISKKVNILLIGTGLTLLVLSLISLIISNLHFDEGVVKDVPTQKTVTIQSQTWMGSIIDAKKFEGVTSDKYININIDEVNSTKKDVLTSLTTSLVDGYSENDIMAIIGNKFYVINAMTNGIEVYKLSNIDDGYRPNITFKFINRIPMPNYEIGDVYSIKCDTKGICTVLSANNIESGCIMSFDSASQKFSDILCSRIGGDFKPKPKNTNAIE